MEKQSSIFSGAEEKTASVGEENNSAVIEFKNDERTSSSIIPFLWNFISNVQLSNKVSGAEEKITESVAEESQKSMISFSE